MGRKDEKLMDKGNPNHNNKNLSERILKEARSSEEIKYKGADLSL